MDISPLQSALSTLSSGLKDLDKSIEELMKITVENEDSQNPIDPDLLSQLIEALFSNTDSGAESAAATAPAPSSGVVKKPGAYAGPKGFLWKPVSDSDGKLAILLPPNMTGKVKGVSIIAPDGSRVIANGKMTGVGNGDREHFRFGRSGDKFPAGSVVQIAFKDGHTEQITIDKPQVRTEGR